ncbi:MAG: NAD(P)H-dependent glycerol-3-phosphate dehydrogenase [Candidatus Omnitrophota bacterium]
MNISVIGDGGWGTAIAVLLKQKGLGVKVWGAFPEYVKILNSKRDNLKFLPGVKIPRGILFSNDLNEVVDNTDLVVLAVPSKYLRGVCQSLSKFNVGKMDFLSVAKGIEYDTLMRMSEVISQELGRVRLAVMSGPNIASEVARGIPSAAVCASRHNKLTSKVQEIFMTNSFRVYTHNDLVGVELAGALKNIIAIACGISDGLGYGTNTKAALLTRGLAEIARLGCSVGAKQRTFSGLSGMGDLVTTCFSKESRNRGLGEQLGKGKKLNDILAKTEMIVEGVITTKSAVKLAKNNGIELPIANEVFNVLFRNKNPFTAVQSLMLRKKTKET